MPHATEEQCNSSPPQCTGIDGCRRRNAYQQHSHTCRGPFTAWQATRILLLVAISLQAQHCTAQPGLLPPMPPLGFFGGLLDGLGLGPSSPPVTSSVPVVSSTYRNPQASPSIQPQDAASASTRTVVPVVSASPATAAGAAAAASAVPASPVTPSLPSVSRAPPAAAAGTAAASAVPVSTVAPASPAAPQAPVTVPRAGAPPAMPATLRPVTTTPAAPVATPALPLSSAPTPVPTLGAAVVITPGGVVVQTPVPSITPAAAKPATTPAATPAATPAPAVPTLTPAVIPAVTAAPAVPTPTPTAAAAVPAATVAPRMTLPPLPRPPQVPVRTLSPTPTPTPPSTPSPEAVDMVPLPAALAPLLTSAPKAAPAAPVPAMPSPPPPPFVVPDTTQTALSAAFLLQGPNVWPFDSGKQAAFVSALQSTLPGIRPGGITVTSTGAPFRRRALLQMMSSALVATQVDAGSAAQVPAVLAQLRNATDQGQLQGAMQTQGLQISSVQLQASTAVVPTSAGTGNSPLSVPFIAGIIVVGVVGLLCIFGAAYFGLFRCCMPSNLHKRSAEEQKGTTSRGNAQNDVAPFFEVPKFQQTYPRPPSLISQNNPVFNPGKPPRVPSRQ